MLRNPEQLGLWDYRTPPEPAEDYETPTYYKDEKGNIIGIGVTNDSEPETSLPKVVYPPDAKKDPNQRMPYPTWEIDSRTGEVEERILPTATANKRREGQANYTPSTTFTQATAKKYD